MVKNNLVNLPHFVTIRARCRIINLDTSVFLGVSIDRGNTENHIHPLLDNLNGSFEIKPSLEIKENKDFCLLEPILYDKSGDVLYDMRKIGTIHFLKICTNLKVDFPNNRRT